MLLPLTPTRHAAWCDRCLRGSEVITFDAPTVARFFAIERLRGAGWLHVAKLEAGIRSTSREESERREREWSAETYCPDCAGAVLAPPVGSPPRVLGPRQDYARGHQQGNAQVNGQVNGQGRAPGPIRRRA